MAQVKVGDEVRIMRPFKVYRSNPGGVIDICDADGNCLSAKENELLKLSNNMKSMKDACLTVAKDLAKAKNTVTTLEIKLQARRDYPYFYWTQEVVSKLMDSLAGDGIFTYTDNGTYRIYSLVNAQPVLTKTVVAGPKTANTISTSVTSIAGQPIYGRKISWGKVLSLCSQPDFECVTLANGSTISRATIKGQKKSPVGYVSPKKGRITSVVAGNVRYNVK